jgi:tetratricopeptide (TPR) repeat protein
LPVKGFAADIVLRYGIQLADGLAHAHERHIVHRDLKTSNIIITRDGRAKILDFGLARQLTTADPNDAATLSRLSLDREGAVEGTPSYMSPEQLRGEPAGPLQDIWALGVVLYEMAAGRRPFNGQTTFELSAAILHHEPLPLPEGAPGQLQAVIWRCLEKDPLRRYQRASELRAALDAVDTGKVKQSRAKPATRREPLAKSIGTAKAAILLGDFANSTGEPMFDGTLRRVIAAELNKAPRLNVLSDARMGQTLRLMRRDSDTKLTQELACEIGERTGSAAVVEGWIAPIGTQYVFGLLQRDCRSGDLVHETQASAATNEDVLRSLGQMAKRFAKRLSESLPDAERSPSFSTEVTTASLEAWRTYSAGMKAMMGKAAAMECVPLVKRAIELDPEFAMAFCVLGRAYDSLGDFELGALNIARAYELRDRVSDPENFFITFNYDRQVTRNLELARQTLESWVSKYPNEMIPHGFLSGFVSPGTGRYQRAAEEGQKAIELDPNFGIGYLNTALANIYLNRLSDAEALLREASERKIKVIEFSLLRYFIAFLRNDDTAMEMESAQRKAELEAQGSFEHQEALTLAYQGRLSEANMLSARAVNLARQGGLVGRAAIFEGAAAAWNALFGNRTEALRSAAAALSLFRSRDADYGPAFALALLNESAQARDVAAELAQRYPQDTSVQFSYLPVLRALEALNENNAAKALEITHAAAPYDLAVPGTAYFTGCFFGALYPVYVRGLAYSRLGRPNEAAAEFQKIVNHPSITLNDPIGPIARLQVARSLLATGRRTESATVYGDLIALWKDADPDLPVIQQARAESGTPRLNEP